jgi:hypothetical protein
MEKKIVKLKISQAIKRARLAIPIQEIQNKVENVGYSEFKRINGIQRTRKVINSIFAEQKNSTNQLSLEKKILGFSEFDLYLSFIQVNYSYVYDARFITKPLSFCLTNNLKIWYPIKQTDQAHFIEEGMSINALVCDLLWKFSVIQRIINQIFEQFKVSLSRTKIANRKQVNLESHSIVFGVDRFALKKNPELYNFRNWFENKIVKDSNTSKISYINLPGSSQINLEDDIYIESLLFDTNRLKKIKILVKTINAFLSSIMKSRWKTSFLILINFKSLVSAQIYRNKKMKDKPISYYFTSLYGNSMPLWAVDELLSGKEIHFIFLASYSEPKFKNNLLPYEDYWQLSRWPSIYLIDKIQEVQLGLDKNEFCRDVFYVGTPDWIDETLDDNLDFKRSIFLFDGEMQRNYKGLSSMYEYGWDEISTNIKFIKDVIIAAKECGFQVYLKPKRDLGSRRFDSYANLLSQIKNGDLKNVAILNENVSVRRLCKQRGVSISKPFSTSGLVSKEESSVSVFYDPLGNRFDGDVGLRGIRLVSNPKDLREFLFNHFN